MTPRLIFLLVFPLIVQGNHQIPDGIDSLARARIVHHVYLLASDSLKGRLAGTESEVRAATYIAEYFRETGIKPAGSGDTSYFQKFRIPKTFWSWENKLIARGHPLTYRDEFGMTAYSKNGNGTSVLVNGRQGLVLPESNLDQLSPLGDLNGKMVLVELQTPPGIRVSDADRFRLDPRIRLQEALDRGALGVIFWNAGSELLDSLFAFNTVDPADGFALYVNHQTGKWLSKHNESPVEFKVSVDHRSTEYINVIGFKDNHASRTILIGAHYDHLGVDSKGHIYYGADDNASGTAGMMELARHFATHPDTCNNYLFIAFGAEETGLLGSSWFVRHPTLPLKSIRFMLDLDMIGRLGWNSDLLEIEGAGSSPAWKKIIKATPRPGFKIKTIKASLPFSDHAPFYQSKIPVLFLNTGLHNDYHTLTDTPGSLNYDGILQIIGYARDIIDVAGRTNDLPFQVVPPIHQVAAWTDFMFQTLGWLFTIR